MSGPGSGPVGLSGFKTAFPASIPAKAGDILGFYTNTPVENCVFDGGSFIFNFQADPAVGDTVPLAGMDGEVVSLNESANLVTTGLALTCSPATVGVGHATTCGATYTGSTHPTGTVTFATNASGTFSSTSCTLVLIGGNRARCSVTYTPNAIPPTQHKIYANYSGDALNPPSHTSTTVNVHL